VARIIAEATPVPTDTRWIDDLTAFVDAQTFESDNSVAAMRARDAY
jgi:hypothetical protein